MQRLHVKYTLFLLDFNESWIFSTDFRRKLKYQVYQNPSSGNRVLPCGQTDMTKLMVAFRSFPNAPKNCVFEKWAKKMYWQRRLNFFGIALRMLTLIVFCC
jgi:hypothetical protein